MAVSGGQSGFGVTFGHATATNGTFTNLTEVVDITPIKSTSTSIDVTNHGSPDGFKEFVQGLRDGGSIDVTTAYVESEYTALDTLFINGTKHAWKAVLPGSSTIIFTAHIENMTMNTPKDAEHTVDFTLRVSGKPVYTAV